MTTDEDRMMLADSARRWIGEAIGVAAFAFGVAALLGWL